MAKGQGSQQSATPQLQRSPPVTPVAAAEAAAGVEGGELRSLPAIVQEAMPQAWKALASCAGKMVDMFQPVAFVENKETDTQVGLGTIRVARACAGGWLAGRRWFTIVYRGVVSLVLTG
jgi:hypothetical protein